MEQIWFMSLMVCPAPYRSEPRFRLGVAFTLLRRHLPRRLEPRMGAWTEGPELRDLGVLALEVAEWLTVPDLCAWRGSERQQAQHLRAVLPTPQPNPC